MAKQLHKTCKKIEAKTELEGTALAEIMVRVYLHICIEEVHARLPNFPLAIVEFNNCVKILSSTAYFFAKCLISSRNKYSILTYS